MTDDGGPSDVGQDAPLTPRRAGANQVSFRAILLGTLVTMAVAVVVPYTAYVSATWGYGWGTLPNGPVVIAFVLVAINGLAARLRPARALTRADVLVIYSILSIAAALIVVHVPYTIGLTAYPLYRARNEYGWDVILPHIPTWLQPRNPDRILWFWEGAPQGVPIPWMDWLVPLTAWAGFALALFVAMLCLGALLSRDWVERQRLTFPLTQIPLAMVGDGADPTVSRSAFRLSAFWIGFLPCSVLVIFAWLHGVFPAVPALPRDFPIGQSFAGAGLPWSALSDMTVRISPAVIGIMALVPGEVSFSVWAFYLIYRLYLVVCGGFGIPPYGGGFGFAPRAFFEHAGAGGFIVISALALYRSRDAFAAGFRRLLRRPSTFGDPNAPMANTTAVLGLIAANGFMLWWALHAGMSWWSYGLIMFVFYASMIGTARLTAAAGLLQHMPPVYPRATVVHMLGARPLGLSSTMGYSLLEMGYMQAPMNFGLNYIMNSYKLFHGERMRARGFPLGVAIATVGVFAACSVGVLWAGHRYGAINFACWPVTAVPTCAFRQFSTSFTSPETPDNWLRAAMVVGGGVTVLLSWFSAHFASWPFSPIGFVIASVMHTNRDVWANALLGWLLAAVIRRYGGLRLYRRLLPAFVGLVLGHYLTDAAMSLFCTLFLGARGVTTIVP